MIPFFTGNFQLSERKFINGNDKKGKGKRCSSDTRCLQASLLKIENLSFYLLRKHERLLELATVAPLENYAWLIVLRLVFQSRKITWGKALAVNS